MKKVALLMFTLLCGSSFGQPAELNQLYTDIQAVYDKVVNADGTVDYATLKDSPELMKPLQDYVSFMATFDPEIVADKNAKIALLSNTYNVFTLVGVTEAWPVESVREIHLAFGFFTKNLWRINHQKVSLNDIENKMLRKLDVRIHFVINCASTSCPPLLPVVLTAENIAARMDEATLAFINDESKNQFDREKDEWRLSKIFDWYKDDWQNEAGVVQFIQKYRDDLRDWKPGDVDYLEYDWNLNGPTERR